MKSKLVAYLLHTFFGVLGAGRFYVGDVGMGLLQLLTLGGCGFLWIADFFLLSGRVDYKNVLLASRVPVQVNINNINNNSNDN
ncbi:TM2 domain-containing protein [Bacillus phage vB_BanS-Thrax4]|nr:TM2 domain-containing protein [Bacillus phage vB_BanS-Thrax4]